MVLNNWIALNRPSAAYDIGESNSQQQFADLLTYARGQQAQGNHLVAQQIYAVLAEPPQAQTLDLGGVGSGAGVPVAIRERAQDLLNAVNGVGGFTAARGEFLAQQFMSQVTDPAALGSMLGAGLTYRLARFGFARALSGMVARGFSPVPAAVVMAGLKPLATGLAFAVEATMFPIYHRLGDMALGRRVDWSVESMRHTIAGSFLMLGGLKVFGFLGQRGVQWWNAGRMFRGGFAEQIIPTFVPTVAMYGGIILGTGAEQRLMMDPKQRMGTGQLLTESLSTLIHFIGAGRVLPHIGGPRLQAFEQRITQQTQQLGAQASLQSLVSSVLGLESFPPRLAAAIATARVAPSRRNTPSLDANILLMENQNGEGGGGNGSGELSLSQQVRSRGTAYRTNHERGIGEVEWILSVEAARAISFDFGDSELTLASFQVHEARGDRPAQVTLRVIWEDEASGQIASGDYTIELSEAIRLGFLQEIAGDRFQINPQRNKMLLVPDSFLAEPALPESQLGRGRRSYTMVVSDVEGGYRSTPPPPPPVIVESIAPEYFPSVPQTRVSLQPFEMFQQPKFIQGVQVGRVGADGRALVWISLSEQELSMAARSLGRNIFALQNAQIVFLDVGDALQMGLVEVTGDGFRPNPQVSQIYLESALASRAPNAVVASQGRPHLSPVITREIREVGRQAFVPKLGALNSPDGELYWVIPESLAQRHGIGGQYSLTPGGNAIELLPNDGRPADKVLLMILGGEGGRHGQVLSFAVIMEPVLAAQLQLIRRNASGDWQRHPNPGMIYLVPEARLATDTETVRRPPEATMPRMRQTTVREMPAMLEQPSVLVHATARQGDGKTLQLYNRAPKGHESDFDRWLVDDIQIRFVPDADGPRIILGVKGDPEGFMFLQLDLEAALRLGLVRHHGGGLEKNKEVKELFSPRTG